MYLAFSREIFKQARVTQQTGQEGGEYLQPPIPKSSCKSNRDVNHPQLARELCPRKWLDEFDKDPDSN